MAKKLHRIFGENRDVVIFNGDCFDLLKSIPTGHVNLTITSPPYCMGKEYETSNDTEDFIEAHERLLPEIERVTALGGSVCWQVGYHVKKGVVTPLDYLVLQAFSKFPQFILRNRIIWTFGHGLHGSRRFSGRHEVILWFTKGENYTFDLDAVRVPQRYPGKKFYKGQNRGAFSSNPLGKNPGDVWEVPVVNASHIEKSIHPCQFPQGLAQRLILGLSEVGQVILDPFLGSGTTAAAAIDAQRRFVGSEISPDYCEIARKRAADALKGKAKFRSIDKPVQEPNPKHQISKRP